MSIRLTCSFLVFLALAAGGCGTSIHKREAHSFSMTPVYAPQYSLDSTSYYVDLFTWGMTLETLDKINVTYSDKQVLIRVSFGISNQQSIPEFNNQDESTTRIRFMPPMGRQVLLVCDHEGTMETSKLTFAQSESIH